MKRRGFVLVATVVVVAAAILVATGAIFAARATTVNARASDSDRRLRMAALDGVALVADALHNARADVLAGKTPTIESLLLVAGEDLDRIEVLAMPLFHGEFVQSEGAKLALEEVSSEMMQSLVRDQADAVVQLAERIVAARPLPSIDGCAALADEGTQLRALRVVMGALRELGEREQANEQGDVDEALPLMGLLTAHAREALVAIDGAPRLDIVAATQDSISDESGGSSASAPPTAALAQFDESEREALENAAKSSIERADDNSIARELIARGVSLARVDELLNQCTTYAGSTAPSRVDIVRADERVLAAIPGIGADKAARIIDLRDTLDEHERRGTSWLVSRRVLSAEEYGAVAGRISFRSTAWRFRVEARHELGASADENTSESSDSGDSRDSSATDSQDSTSSRAVVAFDCIVDVAGDRPRVVFLRDVSMLPTARLLAAALAESTAQNSTIASESADETEPSADIDASASHTSDDDFLPREEAPQDSEVGPVTVQSPPSRSARVRTSALGRDVGGR